MKIKGVASVWLVILIFAILPQCQKCAKKLSQLRRLITQKLEAYILWIATFESKNLSVVGVFANTKQLVEINEFPKIDGDYYLHL